VEELISSNVYIKMEEKTNKILEKITEKEVEFIMQLSGAMVVQNIIDNIEDKEILKKIKEDVEYKINK